MDWLTSHIAIGNFKDAQDGASEVDAILCLKPECCKGRDDVEVLCVPLIDGSGNNPAVF